MLRWRRSYFSPVSNITQHIIHSQNILITNSQTIIHEAIYSKRKEYKTKLYNIKVELYRGGGNGSVTNIKRGLLWKIVTRLLGGLCYIIHEWNCSFPCTCERYLLFTLVPDNNRYWGISSALCMQYLRRFIVRFRGFFYRRLFSHK